MKMLKKEKSTFSRDFLTKVTIFSRDFCKTSKKKEAPRSYPWGNLRKERRKAVR